MGGKQSMKGRRRRRVRKPYREKGWVFSKRNGVDEDERRKKRPPTPPSQIAILPTPQYSCVLNSLTQDFRWRFIIF